MELNYLSSAIRQFNFYKQLGEKAMEQVDPEQLFWHPDPESNSMAIIVNHLAGNMLSRWTDFLTSDGEKSWRQRDTEFDEMLVDKEGLMKRWNEGWECLFNALNGLTDADLGKIVYIRNEGHTVLEAINRQIAHYPYHIGQMVYIAKMTAGSDWQSLSIPKGQSESYNNQKFAAEKKRGHFTDEFLHPSDTDNQ